MAIIALPAAGVVFIVIRRPLNRRPAPVFLRYRAALATDSAFAAVVGAGHARENSL
jgi:hypothetical protein